MVKKKLTRFFGIFAVVLWSFSILASSAQAIIVSPPILDVNLKRGDFIEGKFSVFFKEEDPETFYLYIKQSKYEGEKPTLDLIDPDPEENTLANWTKLDKSQIFKPAVIGAVNGDNVVEVGYQIQVPIDAPAGSHYAGILVTQAPPDVDGNGAQIAIGGEVVYQLLINLNDEKVNDTSLAFFRTKNNQKLFAHLPVRFETGFENRGNVHVIPAANIEIFQSNKKIDNIELNPGLNRVFPGKTKTYENLWSEENIEEIKDSLEVIAAEEKLPKTFFENVLYEIKNFRIGQYKAEIQGFAGTNPPYKDSVTFWVIPYHLLIVIIVPILILILLFIIKRVLSKKTKRSKN